MINTLLFGTTQYSTADDGSGSMVTMLLWLAVIVIMVAATWRIFQKAKQPGWASIVPIYNVVVLLRIANRPVWWILLMLIPIINIVFTAIVSVDVAKAFGKSTAFGIVGLWIFSPIGFLILGFGEAKYRRLKRA